MGLIAHKQLYDNPQVFGLGREIMGYGSSYEYLTDEMFPLPKILKLFVNTEAFSYCIRLPELSCCFYITTMFPGSYLNYKW
jgi:hypothetical protein